MAEPLLKSDIFGPSPAASLSQIALRLADPSEHAQVVSPAKKMQSRLERQWIREQKARKANAFAATAFVAAAAFWMPVALHVARAIAPH